MDAAALVQAGLDRGAGVGEGDDGWAVVGSAEPFPGGAEDRLLDGDEEGGGGADGVDEPGAAGLGALLRGAEDLPVGVEAVAGGLHVGAGRVLGAGGLAVVPVAVLGDHDGQAEGGEAVDEIPFDLHLLLRQGEVSLADALVGAALGFDVVEQVVVDHHERGAGPAVTQLDPLGELRARAAADGSAGDPGHPELLDPVLGDQVELGGVPGDRDRRVLVRPGPAGQGVLDRGAAELLPELLQTRPRRRCRRAGGARRRRC